MNNNAITRDEALEVLESLLDAAILSPEIEDKLADIRDAIENEKYGLHLWGADNEEYAVLYTAVRADEITDEYREKGARIWEKYSYLPSEFEAEEIDANIEEACAE